MQLFLKEAITFYFLTEAEAIKTTSRSSVCGNIRGLPPQCPSLGLPSCPLIYSTDYLRAAGISTKSSFLPSAKSGPQPHTVGLVIRTWSWCSVAGG